MIEKRFTNDMWQVFDKGKPLLVNEQCQIMNELAEENEQLKQDNKELKQDNDIKFWKLQLMEQWNNTQIISHELSLAMENGYKISDKFKTYLDDLKKKHENHIEKIERLGLDD